MENLQLNFRQVHLDFHTSEKIHQIGEKFDPREFVETLVKARVNSITCFARCHHGMFYYQSEKFPEMIHPGLGKRDLLIQQIDACHAEGIKVPVYTTIQWDYAISQKHPEWLCLNADGSIVDFCDEKASPVFEAGFYRTLCVNSPYRDYLKEHIADLFEVLTPERVDGLFLDITNVVDCSCKHCVDGMMKKGYRPDIKEERIKYAKEVREDFMADISAFIRQKKKDASIFYNASHVGPQLADCRDAYTHWELESLPSGAWGYTHFSNSVRYARTLGLDYLAQTGKFHTTWGDFHSFKNKEALEYECFRMLAYNAKCLIGDQLDPDGKISEAVYELIGDVYRQVEAKEKWCENAKPLTDIAVFTSEELTRNTKHGLGGEVPREVNGACAMLDEMGYQFDIVDGRSDLGRYRLVILPDTILCSGNMAAKVKDYLEMGGKVIASWKSGLDLKEDEFVIRSLGIKKIADAPYSPDFIIPNDKMGKNLPKTEHVMYQKGMQVEAAGAEVLAMTAIPYFNRTWEHFCSHRHTPSCHEEGYPAVTRKEGSIYFMHPIFSTYQENHPRWCKELVKDAIEMLLPDPVIRTNGPSTMVCTINNQEKNERYVVHLLHYIPVKTADSIYTIEDVIPLYDVECEVKTDREIRKVTCVPQMQELSFEMKGEYVKFMVPKVCGHGMIELDYHKE